MTENNERSIYGMRVLKNSHKDIRKLRRQTGQANLHGNKFWTSTSLLIDYLHLTGVEEGASILELGCGWGVSGIFCAKTFKANVTALDADDSVFPYLDLHASLNNVTIAHCHSRYEEMTQASLAQYDIIIGSDICFWDELSEPLFDLLQMCLNAGVGRMVLTDPGRQPFRDMAARCYEEYDHVLYDNWSVPHPYNTSGLVLDITSE